MHYLSFPFLDAQIHIVYNHYKGIHHVTIQCHVTARLEVISFFRIYLTICASYEPFIVLFSIIFLHLEEKAFLLTYQRLDSGLQRTVPS